MNAALAMRLNAINAAQYKTKVIDNQSGVQWIGIAVPGSNTSDPVWQIKRITTSTVGQNEVTFIEWADGNLKFDNIMDDANTTVVYN